MRAKSWPSRMFSGAALGVVGLLVLSVQAAGPEDKPAPNPTTEKGVAEKPVAEKVIAEKPTVKTTAIVDGRELFTREWLPNDSRGHGGDGLGPVFNDSSCVACHNQGGTGGGGAANKNVDIVTAFPIPNQQGFQPESLPQVLFQSLFGSLAPEPAQQPTPNSVLQPPTAAESKQLKEREKADLVAVHPGFASSRSVVLHRFSTDPKYAEWRNRITSGQFFGNQMTISAAATSTATFAVGDVAAVEDATPLRVANTLPAQLIEAQPAPAQLVPVPLPPAQPTADLQVVPAPESPTLAAPGQAVALSGSVVMQGTPSPLFGVPEIQQLQNEVQVARGSSLNMTTQMNNVQLSRSQRNATALFGIGLLDSIPEKALREVAQQQQEKTPDMAGRPSKLKDGKIGRFGWKAQKATLDDFALTACAVELGLNVPGHDQGGLALKPDYKSPGLDMNQPECDALVKYLKLLPTPIQRKPTSAKEAAFVDAGYKQFAAVGCANCHVEKLGDVSGVYSDLLLHDMGQELGDAGSYGVFTPNAPEEEQDETIPLANRGNPFNPQPQAKLTPEQLAKVVGALRQEWRTPPLWGVRDSGPYLHDGRADTLEQAVAFHGGQASGSAVKFFRLQPEERQQVIAFLKSLTAPDQTPSAE